MVIVGVAVYANAGSRVYHWIDVNGVNHWSNDKAAAAAATDYSPEIQYNQADAAYYGRQKQRWQNQWNIEANRALKAREIDASVYEAKIRAMADITVAKIKAAARYAATIKRAFAPTYGYSAGLVRSPNFGELRLVRKDALLQKRAPLVVTRIKLNNSSESQAINKNRVKLHPKKK